MTLPAPAPVYYSRRTVAYLSSLWQRRQFVWFLAVGNFRSRNASTTFGLFWWVLNPLLLSMVYFLVFGLLLGSRDLSYLMSGMFVFHYTSQSLTGGANSILQNSKLLANVRFPRLILPIASVLESTLGFLVSIGVLLVLAIPISGTVPGPQAALVLLLVPLQFMFNLGLGCVAARLAVPFRDINNLIPYLNRIWLYLSPIIWPISFLQSDNGQALAPYAEANPMFSLISVYRTALLGYEFQSEALISISIWAVVLFVFGVGLFVKYESRIVRYL